MQPSEARQPAESGTQKIRVGFGENYKELEVVIPSGDIPPYQPGDRLELVGQRSDRVDAAAKVTGRAQYTYDRRPAGMIYGRMLRCPHANADVIAVDLSKARAMPGVRAALDLTKLFELKSVRYAGTGVAAVAADTEQQAEAALRAIEVAYDVLPFAVTTEAAMRETAPQVGRGDQENVVEARRRGRRDSGPSEAEVDAALATADHVIEATFETQVQTHSPLETHGTVMHWEGDHITCYASTQGTFSVRNELTSRNGPVGVETARVITEFVGGGFGSKFGAGREGVTCAFLSKESGRPVRLMLDRREEQTDAGNRPDSIQKIRMGVRNDGSIAAYKVQSWGTPGSGGGGAGAHNDVIYELGLKHKQEYTVRTNTGGARALRAPAWPQGVFALEGMMDMAAERLGVDPIEFRRKHDRHSIRVAEYDIARERSGWDARRRKVPGSDAGPVKRGLGVASTIWFNAGGRGAAVRVRIHKNGTVEVRNGAQDIGTGTRTIMGMCAAEELGLDITKVKTAIGDTDDPVGPGSGGSTTAPTLTPAARLAGFRAKQALLAVVAEAKGWNAADLDLRTGHVVRKDGGAIEPLTFEQACALMVDDQIDIVEERRPNIRGGGFEANNAGVQIAEVEVDTETGEVRVIQVTAVADAGVLINPKLAESQVRGGIIGGVSYALFERRIMDRIEGRMLNSDLENYKLCGAVDCPKIDVALLNVHMGHNNTNVMGLGEPPTIATAAAIANAVHNATGARVHSLPITPRRVLEALERKERQG
ncbi:MAG: xanthine dehydrogenase family protein molybdopterin-binding subunit [Planctomycetes bacterium]|nr:xanthine dehydrogenase family protein molybdopterin-binding subunit [Planctomycetota bacterium]